jgi:hypothetical protein
MERLSSISSALLIEANHVQRVLTSIDTNRVGNGDCLGHGGAILVLFENPYKLCEPLGAGARPVHLIRVVSLQCNDPSAVGGQADSRKPAARACL